MSLSIDNAILKYSHTLGVQVTCGHFLATVTDLSKLWQQRIVCQTKAQDIYCLALQGISLPTAI